MTTRPNKSRPGNGRKQMGLRGKRAGYSRAATSVDKKVGENVRKLRLERNLTLAELGQALGISHQQLQKYEMGANRMSAGMLHATSVVFRVPVEALFDGARDQTQTSAASAEEKLRKQCAVMVDRIESQATLQKMAQVLRALSQ